MEIRLQSLALRGAVLVWESKNVKCVHWQLHLKWHNFVVDIFLQCKANILYLRETGHLSKSSLQPHGVSDPKYSVLPNLGCDSVWDFSLYIMSLKIGMVSHGVGRTLCHVYAAFSVYAA